jgi:gliding motility-associated-like protein
MVSGGSDNNYSFRYVNGVLNILKADQYIIFSDLPDKLRKTQQWQLEAIASSGLPVSFESDDLKKGIIEGSTLIVLKEGHNVIIARQDGNQNWNPATPVSKSYVGQPTFDNVTSMFTPNGDGVNDYWYIPNIEEFGEIQVKVYNRFGKLVYESQYYKNDWDGTFNAAPLPSASYYYVIKSSEKGIINGVVNIVR